MTRRLWTGVLLAAVAVLLALGLTLPVIRVERFVFFSREASLLGIVWSLFESREFLLGGIIGLFSVVFPVAKLGLLLSLWRSAGRDAVSRVLFRRLEMFGRWSMLDVLVAALLVFAIKSTGLAAAASEPGLYCFAAAGLLSMAATRAIERLHGVRRD